MNLKDRTYVQSKYVSKCVKDDNKFFIIHNDKMLEVDDLEIDRGTFCQIPGFRLILSVEGNNTLSVTTDLLSDDHSDETVFFEVEENRVYLINLDRVVEIKNIYSDIWFIQMEDQQLWFRSFPSNFKHVLAQLRK